MRVLFCSTGGLGHLQPMRPLAVALRAQGHAVAWATAPDALGWLADQGMALYPAGPAFGPGRLAFRQRHATALQVTGEALSAQVFPRLFGATLAPAMVEGLCAAVDHWRPDLVVHEPAALAAPLVCAQRGLPCVTHEYGLPVPAAYLEDAMRWFGSWWQRAELVVPAHGGLYRDLAIGVAPPALAPMPVSLAVPHLRLNPCAPGTRPQRRAARRARVYLTFGTVFNHHPALLVAANVAAELGAEVVVSVGLDRSPGDMPVHPRVQAKTFVDQASLLPTCDLVVSHGGAGTVLAAVAHGLPQLVLPQGADHFRNARALAQAGAALVLAPAEQTRPRLREAVGHLLTSAVQADAAQRLAEEMGRMPSPAAAAIALERWWVARSPSGKPGHPGGVSAAKTPASTPAAGSSAR
ncbi:glycosyltransferase [Hydrogenophaga pseudoflava]|uniref:glycosyltransferase n=1 Tax=Hydrogenophaga pseudoflava TaxID=47421 RepID=UPI0027E46513|nr:glycosyltransferase [Hydrogenophaga pseudoflava]MDQ7743089.1 glycosyltransferase [Hydrogenophaga pseudoflava]